jgi:uncharacterized protein YjbI with pentapeptide repeats
MKSTPIYKRFSKATFFMTVAIIVLVIIIIWAAYLHFTKGYVWADWIGFGEYQTTITNSEGNIVSIETHPSKTLWDLMNLLIVPAVLAIAALLFNASQQQREQRISSDHQRESALEAYLYKIGELMTEKNLLKTKDDPESPVRDYAQVLTTTALRSLNKDRQNILLQFFRDSHLGDFILRRASLGGCILSGANLASLDLGEADLSKTDLVGANLAGSYLVGANLIKANLNDADLHDANLSKANLSGSDLRRAILIGAYLSGVDLRRADLSGADLSGVYLSDTDLRDANLSGADLIGADLTGADLIGADLIGANLTNANMRSANLFETNMEGADLKEAKVTEEELSKANSLKGVTMPDGTKHP